MIKRLISALAVLCLCAGVASSQLSPFPQSLPPSTVVGRTGISAGPAQAIPFSILTQQLAGSGSGIFGLTLSGDTNYTMVTTDRTVAINASLTAPRTITLFAAATLASGQQICIEDAAGGVTSTNTLTIARAAADTINGATSYVLGAAFGGACLISDGSSRWTVGAVQNAGLARMPANTLKCNNTTSVAIPIDCTVAQAKTLQTIEVSVTDPAFGAKCDGSTDDTAAIQAAINSLPNDGGIVLFPVANCKISSTLTIGNGTTSTVSTKRGVILRGRGVPGAQGLPFFNGYPTVGGPKLTWAGATSSTMILLSGPLKGWGIQNLFLDCASISGTTAITVVSSGYGDSSNLFIRNCPGAGISSNANPLGAYSGVGNVDSIRNNWTTIDVVVPAVVGAKGILLNGEPGGTSNTDYNTFTNVFVRVDGNANPNFGIFLSVSDNNMFYNVNVSGGGVNTVLIALDYSANANFPNSNAFFGVDSNGNGTLWQNIGVPTSNNPNYAYGVMQANGGTNPNLANLATFWGGSWGTYTPSPSCGSATFTVNSARQLKVGKTVNIEADISFTALGTCGNTLLWSLPATAQAGSALAGQDTGTGKGVLCGIRTTNLNQANCVPADGTNYTGTSRVIIGGVYESQ